MRMPTYGEQPLYWVGSTKRDLLGFPEAVKDGIGTALSVAQFGAKHPAAKPWKGAGSGVLEVVEDHDGNTFRAVGSLSLCRVCAALFSEKVTQGAQTPKPDVELVSQRLRLARQDYEERYGKIKRGT